MEDEGHGQFGISRDLSLDLFDHSTFKFGPIEDLGALDASSVLSSADSFETLETFDIWSFPHDLEEQKATQSRSWEPFYDKIFQEPQTVYTSESGPQAFAIPAAQDGDTKDDGPGRNSGCEIKPAVLVSSLLQLGLGRESVLYRYEEHEESFVPLIGNGRVPGYSLKTVQSLSATFINYGNKTKRLQHLIDNIQTSRKSSPTSIALAASFSAIIATVHAQIGDPSTSAYTLLQLQSLFERPGLILSYLDDMIIEVDVYVRFRVNVSCLVAKLGSHDTLLHTVWGFLLCSVPNLRLQDKLLKQTSAPAPEPVSLIHVSAIDEAPLTQKRTQER